MKLCGNDPLRVKICYPSFEFSRRCHGNSTNEKNKNKNIERCILMHIHDIHVCAFNVKEKQNCSMLPFRGNWNRVTLTISRIGNSSSCLFSYSNEE